MPFRHQNPEEQDEMSVRCSSACCFFPFLLVDLDYRGSLLMNSGRHVHTAGLKSDGTVAVGDNHKPPGCCARQTTK